MYVDGTFDEHPLKNKYLWQTGHAMHVFSITVFVILHMRSTHCMYIYAARTVYIHGYEVKLLN